MKQFQVQALRLETRRLILTIPLPGDAARMCAYAVENKAHLAPWEPLRSESYYTEGYWAQELTDAVAYFQQGLSIRFALLDREREFGRILGLCKFSNIVRGAFQAAHIGYSIDHRAEGKGYMYEALTAAIAYAFTEMHLHRIMANYMPANERSGKLLERLGFKVEGFARDYLLLAGKWQDHVLTALINEHWEGDQLA